MDDGARTKLMNVVRTKLYEALDVTSDPAIAEPEELIADLLDKLLWNIKSVKNQ